MNKIFLIGLVGKSPELKNTKTGQFVQFSLATKKVWMKNGVKEEKTAWHQCVAFGKIADTISKYVNKGDQLAITDAEINYYEYNDKDGVKRYGTNILVHQIEFCSKKDVASGPKKEFKFEDNSAFGGTNFNQDSFDFDPNEIPF